MANNIDKDAFYFPHFSNARHDRKIKRLRKQLSVEGYGIFFMLLEVLREQTDYCYPIEDIDLLADEFGTSTEKVQAVVTGFGLFDTDENDHFFSSNLIFYLAPMHEKREMYRISGYKGNLIRHKYITKEEADRLTPDKVIELAQKHGFTTKRLANNSIVSPPDRHPIATRSPPGRGSSQSKVDKVKKSRLSKVDKVEKSINTGDSLPEVKPPSHLKDELADFYQHSFIQIQPASTWANFGHERKSCNDLANKTRLLMNDIEAFVEEVELAEVLIEQLVSKKNMGKTDYWKNVKITPSGLISRWTEIVQLASQHYQDEKISDEIDFRPDFTGF